MSDIQKNAHTPKNKIEEKKLSRRKVILAAVLLSLIMAGFVEYFGITAREILGILRIISTIIYAIIQIVAPVLLGKQRRNSQSTMKNDDHDMDKWTKIIHMVNRLFKDIKYVFCNSPHITLCIIIIISCCFGIYLGNKQIYARLHYAASEAATGFRDYDKPETKKKIENKKRESGMKETNDGKRIWEHLDENTKEQIRKTEASESEMNETNNLSQTDKEEIFYLAGKYAIENWEDQDDINRKVFCRVKDEIKRKRENVFDKEETKGGAPLDICNKISELSEEENHSITLEKMRDITEERENIFILYPKESLARLVANDYQSIALVFYYNTSDKNNVLYFYGLSIMYRHKTLGFRGIGSSAIKKRVNEIKSSYEDLELISSDKKLHSYAQKLRIAYQYVADQY